MQVLACRRSSSGWFRERAARKALPRLIGLEAALDLVTSGRTVKAAEALRLGLVDRLSSGDLRQDAMELARELIGQPLRRTGEQAL